jgi:hypothetical protein
MSRAMRMAGAGLALPVCLLIAAHAHAQAPAQPANTAPPAPTDKIVRVTADLAAGTFDRVLPFDVPFFIVGQAPEGTVCLQVQYVEYRKREPPPKEGWKPADPAQWKPEAPATANQGFLVFLREPLDAERYYHFRFIFQRQPSAEQTKKFRDAAVSIFDEELKTFFTTETLISGAEARRKLADLLPAITRDPKWTAAPGSFFDTQVGSTARLDQVLSEVRESLAGQAERREILETFATVRIGLFESLGALRANAHLKTVIGAAAKIDDAGIRELVKLDAEGLALVTTTMSPAEIDLLAAGGVMGDLADVWRPADVSARATSYQQLLRRLRQLEHFVRAVSDTDGAARPAIEMVTSPAIVAAVATLNAGPLRTAIQQTTRLSLDMGRLAEALQMRDQGIVRLTNEVTVVFQDVRFIVGSSVADGNTAQKNYVSADGGLLYAGDIDQASLFVGSNIYFRPVNKDAPLSEKGSFSRRFALTVGVTLNSIEDENSATRTDLFADSSLVLGAGIRVTPSIRVGGGALVFKESDPNPLVTKKSAAATWYLSFSFDIDVAKGLQGLGGQFK